MDPNKLSMEEGKQFLKECGIPQRDIDLMTEKWVVAASVEVLIRFPLLPGEDPTARCVPNKNSQPAVSQPNPIPQNYKHQEKRKHTNQSMKVFDKKPNVTKQKTGHCIQPPSGRPTGDKSQKEKFIGTVRPRTPQGEEEETLVKCKNCGAYGHRARSRLCPMKLWNEALPVHPLGSKNEEKLKSVKAQELQTPGIFKKNEGEEKEQKMQEVLSRKTPTQKFPRSSPEKRMRSWEEKVEFCSLLRKPTRPRLFTMNKKKTSMGPVSIGLSLDTTPNMRKTTPSCSYKKGQEENTSGLVVSQDRELSDTLKSNLEDSKSLGSNVTRSVLYEDLLLSSSSEDSDE